MSMADKMWMSRTWSAKMRFAYFLAMAETTRVQTTLKPSLRAERSNPFFRSGIDGLLRSVRNDERG